MLQGYTMAIVLCGNPTPKKLPTGGGEWPTFRTARAQRVHSARTAHGTPPQTHETNCGCTADAPPPRGYMCWLLSLVHMSHGSSDSDTSAMQHC